MTHSLTKWFYRKFAESLPKFNSLDEAKTVLLEQRDYCLELLRSMATGSPLFTYDLSPKSLKALERWYLELVESASFDSVNTDQQTFEECIAAYFGAVAIHNVPNSKWEVKENAHAETEVIRNDKNEWKTVVVDQPWAKGRYYLAVNRGGGVTVSLANRGELRKTKGMQTLFNSYKRMFG